MKIKMTMVSGRVFDFESSKYKSIGDWLKGNFQSKAVWWKPSQEIDILLNFNNIESIEVFK